ncbi:DUF4283 domain protein, partial [Trifolium medium]|nr:DUF4283 domain protein [Trifolium medium]
NTVSKGSDIVKEVRVGEVLVKLGDRQEKVVRVGAQEKEASQNLNIKTLRTGEDKAVSVVQNRIADAGFKELVIIPLGADKVFVRSTTGIDVVSIVDSAKEFFN